MANRTLIKNKLEQARTSIRYLEEALRLQRQAAIPNPRRIASALNYLGRAYFATGAFDRANTALSEARTILEHNGYNQSPDYLQVLTDSGALEQRLSNPLVAQRYYEQSLNLARKLHGNYHPETATVLMQLAQVMTWQSKYTESEKLIREAVNIYHSTLPDKHPDRVNADLSLADLLYLRGQLNEAATLMSQGLTDQQAVYGNESPRLIGTYDSLSKVQLSQGKLDEAEHSAKTQLAIAEKSFGKTSFDAGVAHSIVANVYLKRNNSFKAEIEARLSLGILQSTASPDHQYVASAEYLLAASLVGQHKSKETEPMLRENMARWTRAEAPAWRVARSESLLGAALLQLHKPKDAAAALNHSYEVLSAKDSGADADTIAVAKKRVDEYQRCVAEHRLDACELPI